MLAFVANTTASWESFMNTSDNAENDRTPDRLVAAASADPVSLPAKRPALFDSVRAEQGWGAKMDFRSRFITALLRALSAWPA